ncbi:MAG: protein phosphatase CheZ [Sedimenticolaceae bacterium]
MQAEISDSLDAAQGHVALARALADHLETGSQDEAMSVLAQLAGFHDSVLFQQVGRLARELHDSINSFVLDAGLEDVARQEMPDAAQRLRYVIATTEQATNATLGAVEDSLPLANSLRSHAHDLAEKWAALDFRQLSNGDYLDLSRELSGFLAVTQTNTQVLHEKLSDVLVAQAYQDITGQVIRKVIDLVNNVEDKLVELVCLAGQPVTGATRQNRALKNTAPQGPAVPGFDQGDLVSGQDDVDELLSSLGF